MILFSANLVSQYRHRRRLKLHPLQVSHKQDWGQEFTLLPPQTSELPDQKLAVMVLSQHRVSSFKIIKVSAPCGARYMEHASKAWSAVCSVAPHSQFGEELRPHMCMDEWNHSTTVHRQLSLTKVVRGKLNPTGLVLVVGKKSRSLDVLPQYFVLHL